MSLVLRHAYDSMPEYAGCTRPACRTHICRIVKIVLFYKKKQIANNTYAIANGIRNNFLRLCLHNPVIFRPLIRILKDVICAAVAGKVTALVLLDLSSAFDTVDHAIKLINVLVTRFQVGGSTRTCPTAHTCFVSTRKIPRSFESTAVCLRAQYSAL